MYARAGAGPPATVTLLKNVAIVVGICSCCGTPTRPTAPPGRAMPSAVTIDCRVADALEHGVSAEAAGELAHTFDGLVAALADDVGGAERAPERDPVGMPAEQDDLLGAEALGGDDAAEPDGAVADDRSGRARRHPRGERRMVTRSHHVGERQQRRHERVVLADRQHDERAVRERDAHRFALRAVDAVPAPEAAVDARGLQSFMAEDARAVGVRERRDDDVARLSPCGRRRRRPRRCR